MERDTRPPTAAQIDLIYWLIQENKIDPKCFYGIEFSTRRKAQEVVDTLSEGVDVTKCGRRWRGH